MTGYVVLIVGDADRWWTSMSLKERQDGYAEYARFGEELARRGGHHPQPRARAGVSEAAGGVLESVVREQ